ncbi:MAG: molybdopterin-dependent oxidoreductase, partial [Raoultibacter sp.]
MDKTLTRRSFIKTTAAAATIAAIPAGFSLTGCAPKQQPDETAQEEPYTGLPFGADETGFVKCGHGDVCGMYHVANTYVKDGVIVGYEGCPEGHNKGGLCPRGISGLQVIYSPHRLKYPMKTSKRGSGEWERITWDEAYATIAEKMATAINEHGAHTVSCSDAHVMTVTCAKAFERFRALFGFPNGKGPDHCWSNLMVGAWPALGDYTHMKESELCKSKLIIFWGHNPALAMPTEWRDGMMKAKLENDAKFIVVDPYFTATAEKADLFLQIRPGSDAALALGIANVMITEDLVNHEFIDTYTVGYEEYKELALQYTPEKVAEITWVPAEKIIEFAHMYAELSPAVIEMGRGGNYVSGDAGWLCSRGTSCLTGLKGDLGKVGGGFSLEASTFSPGCTSFIADWPFNPYKVDRITTPVLDDNGKEISGGGSFKGTSILYEGKPFRYEVYMTHTDIASKWADQNKLEEGLSQIPFIVVHNSFINYTAQNFADIVLPCTSWAEDAILGAEYSHMVVTKPAIEPMFESKPTYLMFAELTDYLC